MHIKSLKNLVIYLLNFFCANISLKLAKNVDSGIFCILVEFKFCLCYNDLVSLFYTKDVVMEKNSKLNNKWFRAAIPALLIHCSIGTVYCWSTFKQEIADYIGQGLGSVEWAFSLAIFFLGMSAAFAGNFVERNVKKSSLLSAIFFFVGMAGTGLFIYLKSFIGILICYGVIMGIGLGIGYLTPVKTLMLWFKDHKGLATGLAVAGFGAAKIIGSPLMQGLMNAFGENGVYIMFFILACVYLVLMLLGHLLIKKPDDWVEHIPAKSEHSIRKFFSRFLIFKNPVFIGVWLIFFINITCGLAIISQEKALFSAIGLVGIASILSSLSAVFNAGGRIAFSTWGDYLKNRNSIYKIIFTLSIAFTLICAIILTLFPSSQGSIIVAILVITMVCVINAGYGGGFSNLPTLLSDNFGMKSISSIHGIALSAWAFAGLCGNQMATAIVDAGLGYQTVLYVAFALFVVALIIDFVLVKSKPKVVEGQRNSEDKPKESVVDLKNLSAIQTEQETIPQKPSDDQGA